MHRCSENIIIWVPIHLEIELTREGEEKVVYSYYPPFQRLLEFYSASGLSLCFEIICDKGWAGREGRTEHLSPEDSSNLFKDLCGQSLNFTATENIPSAFGKAYLGMLKQ